MGGELASVMDRDLQALAFHSLRHVRSPFESIGLAVLAFALRMKNKPGIALVVAATSVVLLGFTLMGHTASHSPRWLLMPLLLAHLLVVAFWFGALVPLRLAISFETPRTAGAAIEAFSTAATWIVPALFVAGSRSPRSCSETSRVCEQPYGQLSDRQGPGLRAAHGPRLTQQMAARAGGRLG